MNSDKNISDYKPAPIASNVLYAAATTALNADASAGRFTVELEYSVF